jgi:hypothetical protein
MSETRDPEIRQLAVELLKHRGFAAADAKLPVWSPSWPKLVIEGWAWGDGDEGHVLLELHVTIDGHPVAVLGDGELWWRDSATETTLEAFDVFDQFPTLSADETMKVENALDLLYERFDGAIKRVTRELMDDVRELAVRWVADAMRQ